MTNFKPFLSQMVNLVKHEEASKVFGRELFYTDEKIYFITELNGSRISVIVPEGFLTDGVTVPKILQGLFPVWDSYYQAAVIHDYLCEYLTVHAGYNLTDLKITRTEADEIFNDLMKFLKINPVKRKLVNAGVILYSHFKSIVYPSADVTKRKFEDEVRKQLVMRDKAKEDQKKS